MNIGITASISSPISLANAGLKRQVLFFDKIYFVDTKSYSFDHHHKNIRRLTGELDNFYVSLIDEPKAIFDDLYKHQVVDYIDFDEIWNFFSKDNLLRYLNPQDENLKLAHALKINDFTKAGGFTALEECQKWRKTTSDSIGLANELSASNDSQSLKALATSLQNIYITEFYSVMIARIYLSIFKRIESVPLFNNMDEFLVSSIVSENTSNQLSVIKLVVNEVPTIDHDIEIQKLIDFKNNETTQYYFRQLRLWIRSTADNENFNLPKVEDELKINLFEYQRYLEKHNIMGGFSVIKAFINGLKNAAVGNYFASANNFFELGKSDVFTFQDSETPGKEVGYIVRVKEHFS